MTTESSSNNADTSLNRESEKQIEELPLTCCTGRMIHKLSVTSQYDPPEKCSSCPMTLEENSGLVPECILSIAHDLICFLNRDGLILEVSHDWTTLLDFSIKESIGKPLTDFVAIEDQLITNEILNITRHDRPIKNFINRLIDRKKGIHWFEWNFVAASNEKIIFGIAREISLYKQIEKEYQYKANILNERLKELKCLNEVTRLLHNNKLDAELDINKILSEIKGAYQFPEATHVALVIDEKSHFSENYKNSQLKQSAIIKIEEVERGHLTVNLIPEDIEDKTFLEDFSEPSDTIPESELYFLNEEQTLLYSLAELLAVYLQKLENNKQTHLLATIVENSADAIVSADFSGKILFWNKGAEKLYGLPASKGIGSSIAQFDPNRDGRDLEFFIRECSQGRSIKGYESERIKPTGERIIISLNVSPLVNDRGEVDHFLAMVKDITSQKAHEQVLIREAEKAEEILRMSNELMELKEKAEESAKLKSSLLLNMGHELRTPLNGILGFSSLIKEMTMDDDMRDMIEFINISGRRLLVTLSSILDLSQLESDTLLFSPAEYKPSELLDHTINEFADNLKHKNLRLSSNTEDCGSMLVDKKLITSIFYHIIDNAIKFTEEGQVWVSLRKETMKGRNGIKFCVKDTGVGISSEMMKNIYEPFRQGSEGLGRSHEGNGLGLTLCKSFLDLMEATIDVDSEAGIGSTFTVWIDISHANEAALRNYRSKFMIKPKPVARLNEQPGSIPVSANLDIGSKRRPLVKSNNHLKPRLMVVEDNDVNASLAELILREEFTVEVALNASVAIKLATLNSYDLILMDINLGVGMDGIQASREIWKIPGNEHLPIIAVIGYTSDYEKQLIMRNGFSAFMAKPYHADKLLELIHEVLQIIS